MGVVEALRPWTLKGCDTKTHTNNLLPISLTTNSPRSAETRIIIQLRAAMTLAYLIGKDEHFEVHIIEKCVEALSHAISGQVC